MTRMCWDDWLALLLFLGIVAAVYIVGVSK
jgi:hypothetical protein